MLLKAMVTLPLAIILSQAMAQKPKPYRCGWVDNDTAQLSKTYHTNLKYWGAQKGETIASVGAQNGSLEVRLALYRDSLTCTLQDIDSSCLNQQEFDKVLQYYQALANKKINSQFQLVLGTPYQTNLPARKYHRILLINVYHELTQKRAILNQLHTALLPDAVLVIMERMGNKVGKKRKDCHHIMPYEPTFIAEFKQCQFELQSKTIVKNLSYYTFVS